MAIALGIDTGGTYTDAVLLEYGTNRVLASAKALTTKHDLSIGIREAVGRVLEIRSVDVHLVSVSTTLATNAIVEGQGAPICALLIGYEGRADKTAVMERELGTDRYVHVPGGHATDGTEWHPLDLEVARRAIREHAPHVAAFAISGYFGTRNPSHELTVDALVAEETGLPTTCGHELTHRLDAIRRATTVALNARLIPLLCELIDAVTRTMAEREIDAPLMVVKGDGSLMSANVARERPIETILSGPAASVVGAQHLAGGDEMVIVDMGGTTTDIAIVDDGQPQLSPQGARVGRWRTMVEAIDVHTVGLGGDSRVWFDHERTLRVGPNRIVPLCLLACQHPRIIEELSAQLEDKPRPTDGEYMVLQRHHWSRDGDHPPFEQDLLDSLRVGPLSFAELHRIVRHPSLYARYLAGLERQGVLVRAGLTPTDASHVTGQYDDWNAQAARLGADLLARRSGLETDELCQRIIEHTSEEVAAQVVTKLLADEGHNGHRDGDDGLISRALHPERARRLALQLTLHPSLVAVGAPVATYFPKVSALLNAALRIPEHTGVANAIGAVVGSVVSRVHILIVPHEDEGLYRVHLPDHLRDFGGLSEAVAYAEDKGRALTLERARRAGAEEIRVRVERHDQSAPVGNDWGDKVFLQSTLDITAIGRPRLAH